MPTDDEPGEADAMHGVEDVAALDPSVHQECQSPAHHLDLVRLAKFFDHVVDKLLSGRDDNLVLRNCSRKKPWRLSWWNLALYDANNVGVAIGDPRGRP